MISADSCSQLVGGNFDVTLNSSSGSSSNHSTTNGGSRLKAILTEYLERFEQLEYELTERVHLEHLQHQQKQQRLLMQQQQQQELSSTETSQSTKEEDAIILNNCGYINEFKLLKEFSKNLKLDKDNIREGEDPVNQRKNRYKDILPFSHTRVVLSSDPLVPGSCYINANYIRGPSGSPQAYIACQGPLYSTLVDFWRMIWECNVSVIVMACNEHESGKSKCEIYWPEKVDQSCQYGDFKITLLKERQINEDFLVRKFAIQYRKELKNPLRSQEPQQQTAQTTITNTNQSSDETLLDRLSTKDQCTNVNRSCDNDSTSASISVPNEDNNYLSTISSPSSSSLSSSSIKPSSNSIASSSDSLNGRSSASSTSKANNEQLGERSNNDTNCNSSSSNNSTHQIIETRTICQFHYTTWPDHGAPIVVQPILELVRLVRDVQPTEDRPIVVHCSAGCGRTGTICCIDYVWGLLRRGRLDRNFDLCRIISDMRQQRMAMVQTLEQYILCHRAVAALFVDQLKLLDDHTYENLEDLGIESNSSPSSSPAAFQLSNANSSDIQDTDELGAVFI